MSHLIRRARQPDENGLIHNVTPENANWNHVGFELFSLEPGAGMDGSNLNCETCAVIISGRAEFWLDKTIFATSEHRNSPFTDPPTAFYAPNGADWRVLALTKLELAVCKAPAKASRRPLFIQPGDIDLEQRGSGNNTRMIYDILPEDRDCAESLLVVEARTPAGSWSSYPPHKHDVDNLPKESLLEETYYYRIEPNTGFAVQRVYTDDRSLDETMTVYDRDLVLVPRGYHPVGAPHGYEIYYLNVMAGPKRVWRTFADPDHAWLLA